MKRPAQLVPPKHLSPSPPVPLPEVSTASQPIGEKERLDPTRYGDWARKGVAVDF
ncbi:MAG: DUF1674 domain-containing protein [Sphingomicrobium sp.]